jgi:hypothetical protein
MISGLNLETQPKSYQINGTPLIQETRESVAKWRKQIIGQVPHIKRACRCTVRRKYLLNNVPKIKED